MYLYERNQYDKTHLDDHDRVAHAALPPVFIAFDEQRAISGVVIESKFLIIFW